MIRVQNWYVRVRENLLISFFRSAWTGEGERKNNSKFTDPNHPISDSGHKRNIVTLENPGEVRPRAGDYVLLRHLGLVPELEQHFVRRSQCPGGHPEREVEWEDGPMDYAVLQMRLRPVHPRELLGVLHESGHHGRVER